MSKTKVTVWLEDKLLAVIDDQAKAQGLSRSAVTSAHLERVLRQGAEESGVALIVPTIKELLRREVGAMSDRLAHLLVRAALEAATARSLVYNEAVHRAGPEAAQEAHKEAYAASVARLKGPAKGLLELLGGEDGGR